MKLRVLILVSMENLVEWWTTESSTENEEFLIPNLHLLEVLDCPRLKFLPYPPRSMIWALSNSETVLPERGFGKLSSSVRPSKVILKHCSFTEDKWDRLQYFPSLEIFHLDSVSGFRTLSEVILCFTSLTGLHLWSLKDLETLPTWLGHLGSLQVFDIRDCCNVTSLPESMKNLAALKKLKLKKCNGLEMLPEWLGQLSSLEEILIDDCPKLTSLPESMKDLIALTDLTLLGCNGLEMLPEWLGQLTCLEELIIGL
uniref:Disease resistance R13L4/SHOC-2-like LRR domain-containing protein n=2 Tax=Triticum urartu TaxID=4572 RepID=A0A8R7R7Y6_TRIUA